MKPSDYIRKGWCQNQQAVDNKGMPVEGYDKDAVAWCAFGAIVAAYPEDALARENVVTRLYDYISQTDNSITVASWNDKPTRSQREVIATLEAIGE